MLINLPRKLQVIMTHPHTITMIVALWTQISCIKTIHLETRAFTTLTLSLNSSFSSTQTRTSFYGNSIQIVPGSKPPRIFATAPTRNLGIPDIGKSSAGRIYQCGVNFNSTNSCSAKGIPPSILNEDTFPLTFDHKKRAFRACSPAKTIQCGLVPLTPGVCFISKDQGRNWKHLTSDTAACPMDDVDLIFVLDGSKSVGTGNFEKVKSWISDLSARFRIEQRNVRVGVIQYSHYYDQIPNTDDRQIFIKTEIELGKYSSTTALKAAISKIPLQGYTTYTAIALNKTVKDFQKSERWSDRSTSKVLVLLTDGSATDKSKLGVTARYVRSLNITTIAIGVGDYDINQLRTIATGNISSDERVYSVNGFDGLNAIISSLTSQIMGLALEGSTKKNESSTLLENAMKGFSIDSTSLNGRLYLGAVGAYDWSGTVTKYDTLDDDVADIPSYEEVKRVLPNRTKESYMGYSVTTGTFNDRSTEYVATGAPRYKLMGAVVIYKPLNEDNKFNQNRRLMGHPSTRKLGSYFGGSVLSADINKDGIDDLLVGAPLYVHQTFDEGRVFVYQSEGGRGMLDEWAKDTYEPTVLVGDNLEGGRFGTAMANAGDLNKDTYNDVIIGAPLAEGDRGAVFVYHGGPDGIDKDFKQKILASQLTGVTLKYFGQSLQGGVDLDGNDYPDIAVGAPKSDTVVIFRTRPVVNIAPTITFTGDATIDIVECIVKNKYLSCSNVEVCLGTSGNNLEPNITIKFNVTLDTKKSGDGKRLEFRDESLSSGSAKFTWSSEVKIPRKGRRCFTKPVHMKSTVSDYDSTVTAEVEYDLTPEHTAVPMSSVRDPSKPNKKDATLTFTQDCQGPCNPDLGVTLSLHIPPYPAKDAANGDLSKNQTTLVIGRGRADPFTGRVNFSNSAENAIGARVKITYNSFIGWTKVKVIASEPRSNSCVIPDPSASTDSVNGSSTQVLKFDSVTNIMQRNSYCYFEFSLITDPLKNIGSHESFTVEVESYLTSDSSGPSKDENPTNNKRSQAVGLLYTSDMNAKEVGSADITFNYTTTLTRNITYVKEIGNGTDDIVTQFTISGTGYSSIPVIEATLNFPWQTEENDTLLYLYDVQCDSPTSESGTTCTCDRTNVNYYNLSTVAPVENMTDDNYLTVTRRTTVMDYLQYDCNNASSPVTCQALRCTVMNLGGREEVTFKAIFRLWTDNLFLNSTDERLELRSRFEINTKKSASIIDANGRQPIVQTLESAISARLYQAPSTPEPVADNLWIYILAAVGGLLLLIILVVILWKLGFFKSKYADMKKDAQEDLAEETEFPDQNGAK